VGGLLLGGVFARLSVCVFARFTGSMTRAVWNSLRTLIFCLQTFSAVCHGFGGHMSCIDVGGRFWSTVVLARYFYITLTNGESGGFAVWVRHLHHKDLFPPRLLFCERMSSHQPEVSRACTPRGFFLTFTSPSSLIYKTHPLCVRFPISTSGLS